MIVEFINQADPHTVFFEMDCEAVPRIGETVVLIEVERKREYTVVAVEHICANPNRSPRASDYRRAYNVSVILAEKIDTEKAKAQQ